MGIMCVLTGFFPSTHCPWYFFSLCFPIVSFFLHFFHRCAINVFHRRYRGKLHTIFFHITLQLVNAMGQSKLPSIIKFIDCFHGFFLCLWRGFFPSYCAKYHIFFALQSFLCQCVVNFLHFFFIFFHRCVQYLKIPCVILS